MDRRRSFGEDLLCDSVDVPGSSSGSWGASRRRREGRDSGQVNDGRRPHRPREVRTSPLADGQRSLANTHEKSTEIMV